MLSLVDWQASQKYYFSNYFQQNAHPIHQLQSAQPCSQHIIFYQSQTFHNFILIHLQMHSYPFFIYQTTMNHKLGSQVIYGSTIIPFSQIFLSRKNVFAIINHKPLFPGHVLICSRRIVTKLSQLTQIQILDLFVTAQEVAKKLSSLNNCTYNISMQNGKQAGQTMPHIHLHLVPTAASLSASRRKEGAQKRSEEDMAIQAAKYRTCFQQSAN